MDCHHQAIGTECIHTGGLIIYESLSSEVMRGFEVATEKFVESLPEIIGAVLLLLVGLIAAYSLRAVAASLLRRLLARAERLRILQARTSLVSTLRNVPDIVGATVFWLIIVFFCLVMVESLGFKALTDLLARFTNYIPRIIAAVIIILAGLFLGDVLRNVTARSLRRYGFVQEQALAQVTHVLVVAIAIILGIDQLGIDSTIITWTFIITFGTVLGSGGLAFAIGARQMIGNMLAIRHIMKEFPVGEPVRIGDIEGVIAGFSNVAVKVRREGSELHIPASRFLEDIVTVKKNGN